MVIPCAPQPPHTESHKQGNQFYLVSMLRYFGCLSLHRRQDRVTDCTSGVCSTGTERVASWHVRPRCTTSGVGTSKTCRFSELSPCTELATGKRGEQRRLLARRVGNMKGSQLSSVAGVSTYANVMCSIYQKSLSIYLLNEFLHSFNFEHVTENTICNSAKSLCAWRCVIYAKCMLRDSKETCCWWIGRHQSGRQRPWLDHLLPSSPCVSQQLS